MTSAVADDTKSQGQVGERASGRRAPNFVAGLALGGGLVALAAALLVCFGSFGVGVSELSFTALPQLHAELGDGDYLFLPNRKNVWVVNAQRGRIIHYKFLDSYQSTVERSYVGQIDQQQFPPEDTAYVLSERNTIDLLWVCNKRTGAFQLWRRNVRDGRLVTDPVPVNSGTDLENDAAIKSSLPPQRE